MPVMADVRLGNPPSEKEAEAFECFSSVCQAMFPGIIVIRLREPLVPCANNAGLRRLDWLQANRGRREFRRSRKTPKRTYAVHGKE